MAGRATWAGMPFPCKWMKRGRQLPIRVGWNRAPRRAQEGNLRGGDLDNGLALIFPFTMKNIEKAWGYKVTGKRAGTKKGAPWTLYPRGSGWKEAATYSPALHCSTIGASGLNFSVRNGKRWDPTAITTWCLFFSWLVRSWQVDKLFVSFAAVITSSNSFTRPLSTC